MSSMVHVHIILFQHLCCTRLNLYIFSRQASTYNIICSLVWKLMTNEKKKGGEIEKKRKENKVNLSLIYRLFRFFVCAYLCVRTRQQRRLVAKVE